MLGKLSKCGIWLQGEGENITVTAAVIAASKHVPPMLIFPRAHFKDHFKSISPTASTVVANQQVSEMEISWLTI